MSSDRFDQAAGSWDLEDRRVRLAQAVTAAIAATVPLSRDLEVLDFGAGTGLVALALAGRVGPLTCADTSTGMLAALVAKAAAAGTPVRALPLDPEGATPLGGPYHLIVSSMTLHHLADVPAAFRQFAAQLHPGGRVALADLDREDGSFHEDAAGVFHLGFEREQIRLWLEQAGFRGIQLTTAAVTRKAGRDYPVFLAAAVRGA
jgi:SAM-dependent methyltransferase